MELLRVIQTRFSYFSLNAYWYDQLLSTVVIVRTETYYIVVLFLLTLKILKDDTNTFHLMVFLFKYGRIRWPNIILDNLFIC